MAELLTDALGGLTDSLSGLPNRALFGDRMEQAIRQVGSIANEEKRADALAGYAQETVSDIARRVAKIPRADDVVPLKNGPRLVP